MAKENETISDIIEEKRREANYIVQVAQGKCHTRRDNAEDEARDIRREADRLEAAHKREIDELKKQVGNAANLRELAELVSHMNDDGYWNGSASICALVEKAKDALAAPARICDVLGEEAMINIVKSEIGKHVPMATDHERKIAKIAATAALATAYATVSTKEGEAGK